MIDPPSGWRYGFPQPIFKDPKQELWEWLVEKGYPEESARWAAEHCRYWEEEVNNEGT